MRLASVSASTTPGCEAASDEKEHFAHHHRDYVAAQCPERNADADFAGPPQDCVGHDAIEPNDGEQRGYAAKDRGEAGDQPLRAQRESNLFAYSLGLRHADKNRDFNNDQLFGLGDDSQGNDQRSGAGRWMIGAQQNHEGSGGGEGERSG